MTNEIIFDRTWKIAKLNALVNAIMIAYWGQAVPADFAEAERNACKVLDDVIYAAGSKRRKQVPERRITEALEWLAEASKYDEPVANQFGFTWKAAA